MTLAFKQMVAKNYTAQAQTRALNNDNLSYQLP